MLGLHATPERVAEVRHMLGLDVPPHLQYFYFLANLFHGDLGQSITFGQPVRDLIQERLPATLFLVAYSAVLSLVLALPMATIAALRRDRTTDQIIRVVFLILFSTPSFWIGTIFLILFSLDLALFPVAGWGTNFVEHVYSLFLPALTLSLFQSALLVRNLRSTLIDVLNLPYVDFAKMKGLRPVTVFVWHVLRTSLGSTVTILGLNVGNLLTGTVVVEYVFTVPGTGTLLLGSVFTRDYPIIQAVTLVYALLVIGINVMTDLTYAALDPRVRLR